MITASVKTTKTKILGTLCIILAVIIGVILFAAESAPSDAAESISLRVTDNEQRTEYLASKGIQTAAEPSLVEDVFLPEEMDAVLSEYNKIQLSSGFDIVPYLGKTVKKYVYPIEDKPETYASLYVYNEKIIAADIASYISGEQWPIDGIGDIG